MDGVTVQEVDIAIATEVVKAWRKNQNIWEAAEPVAQVRDAGRVTFRERYDLMRKIDEFRLLAERLDRDADDMSRDWVSRNGARWLAGRIREVLDA